jgi:hypothetical protein
MNLDRRCAAVWAALALWQAALAVFLYQRQSSDWFIFEAVGRGLLGRGPRTPVGTGWAVLHVYARMPRFQVGPPGLLLATPLQVLPPAQERVLACSLMASCSLVILALAGRAVTRATGSSVSLPRMAVTGGMLVVPWTVLTVKYLHLDDVLALVLVVATLSLLLAERPAWAAFLMGTAAASKPWAVVAFGLVVLAGPRPRMPILLAAASTCLLWWLPFFIADGGTATALVSTDFPVSPASLAAHLGLRGWSGAWLRPLQLGVALSAGFLLGTRRPLLLLVVVLSLRCLLDVQAWPYYWAGPAVGAVVAALAGYRVGWWVLGLSVLASGPTVLRIYGASASVEAIASALLAAGLVVAVACSFRRRADAGSDTPEFLLSPA